MFFGNRELRAADPDTRIAALQEETVVRRVRRVFLTDRAAAPKATAKAFARTSAGLGRDFRTKAGNTSIRVNPGRGEESDRGHRLVPPLSRPVKRFGSSRGDRADGDQAFGLNDTVRQCRCLRLPAPGKTSVFARVRRSSEI